MRLRLTLVRGLVIGSLAMFGLACEVDEEAGEELVPTDGATEQEGG